MNTDPLRNPQWDVLTLGTGGGGCPPDRAYPAVLLRLGPTRVLIDAGDGAWRRIAEHDSAYKPDIIVLTALNAERTGGLITLLDSALPRTRPKPPVVIGPEGTSALLAALASCDAWTAQTSVVHEVQEELRLAVEGASLVVRAVAGGTLGVALREPEVIGRFDVEQAKRLGLQPGPAYRRLQLGETVDGIHPSQVIGPPRPGRRLAVLGPCRPHRASVDLLQGASLAVVVAPYIDERQEIAAEGGVMTGVEAALMATRADVSLLVLTRLSGATRLGYARREAAQFHGRVVVSGDGDLFTLPLSDNREVAHSRAVERRRGTPSREPRR